MNFLMRRGGRSDAFGTSGDPAQAFLVGMDLVADTLGGQRRGER